MPTKSGPKLIFRMLLCLTTCVFNIYIETQRQQYCCIVYIHIRRIIKCLLYSVLYWLRRNNYLNYCYLNANNLLNAYYNIILQVVQCLNNGMVNFLSYIFFYRIVTLNTQLYKCDQFS